MRKLQVVRAVAAVAAVTAAAALAACGSGSGPVATPRFHFTDTCAGTAAAYDVTDAGTVA